MENLTYEQAIEKDNIKKYILKNYPIVSSNPKMKRSLNNFSYEELYKLKNMLENK
tara:strand:- start:239 stop:403 length:165 start_codon:yes stop_codon:yes gene_type:complete